MIKAVDLPETTLRINNFSYLRKITINSNVFLLGKQLLWIQLLPRQRLSRSC
jgi:hypothetical protein